MNARYYDTATGRFISEDSYRGTGETFWHLYAYCDDDPVNFIDSAGYSALPIAAPGYLYKDYKTSVSYWANKYAPMSKGVEYDAIIYRVRVVLWTRYFIGETYKGFRTQNW